MTVWQEAVRQWRRTVQGGDFAIRSFTPWSMGCILAALVVHSWPWYDYLIEWGVGFVLLEFILLPGFAWDIYWKRRHTRKERC